MDNTKNKETILSLYGLFNKKQFGRLSKIISADYTNPQGGKGVEGFQKSILGLAKAFPDAQWKAEEIVADSNIVVVKQKFSGTQTEPFQNIQSANQHVSVDGIATYKLLDGTVIFSHVLTDRLGFLQQLGVLPTDISATDKEEIPDAVYFIDKFIVPKTSIEDFKKQMIYNRDFLKALSGYLSGEVLEQYDNEGNLAIMTIAVWENQDKLNNAKYSMQTEFLRTGFNPTEFYQRLNIKAERGLYKRLQG